MSDILHEYMANADVEEAVEYVHDLNAPHFHHEVRSCLHWRGCPH